MNSTKETDKSAHKKLIKKAHINHMKNELMTENHYEQMKKLSKILTKSNDVTNLEVLTPSDHMKIVEPGGKCSGPAQSKEIRGYKLPTTTTSKKINRFNNIEDFKKESEWTAGLFKSSVDAATKTGCNRSSISNLCNNKMKSFVKSKEDGRLWLFEYIISDSLSSLKGILLKNISDTFFVVRLFCLLYVGILAPLQSLKSFCLL